MGGGRFDDAIDALLKGGPPLGAEQTEGPKPVTQTQFDAAVQILRAAAGKAPPPAEVSDFSHGILLWGYVYTKTSDRTLDAVETSAKADRGDLRLDLRYVWWPVPSSLRRTERFKMLM